MDAKDPKNTREGGREAAEPLTSGISRNAATLLQGRNSSGNASQAANLLDLRQKVNFLMTVVEGLAAQLGDPELAQEVASYRQRGFRRGR